jgi:predicted nucleic acid-binding protein
VKKYVLDTSLYIRAIRDSQYAEGLKQFFSSYAPSTFLSSIVLHELLVGANTIAKAREIDKRIARPLMRVNRVITPSHAAWVVAGTAVAQMSKRHRRDLRSIPKSLIHDFLLAASLREVGVTLVTENIADFDEIAGYIPVSYEAPWPS